MLESMTAGKAVVGTSAKVLMGLPITCLSSKRQEIIVLKLCMLNNKALRYLIRITMHLSLSLLS